jgi:hypothetical protein
MDLHPLAINTAKRLWLFLHFTADSIRSGG